jgi:hypothetical protein
MDAEQPLSQPPAPDPAQAAEALERRAGTEAAEAPDRAAGWLTEAAALWAGPAGDPRRAARALRAAIEIAPLHEGALAAILALYRANDKHRSLARILERRAETLLAHADGDPEALRLAADAFTLLGDLLRDEPLASASEAVAAYGRAIATGAARAETFRAARAIHLAAGQVAEVLALFAREREQTADVARAIALFREEATTRAQAGDLAGASAALRLARACDPTNRALDEALGASVLARLDLGEVLPADELGEAADLYTALGERGGGEAAWQAAERCFAAAGRWEDASWAAEKRGDYPRAVELLGHVLAADAEARVRVGLREARLAAVGLGDARRASNRYASLLHEIPPDCDVPMLERLVRADRGGTGDLVDVAAKLETVAMRALDVRALKLAFGLAASALTGAARAAELVRQAEVLAGLGADRPLALRHGEAGLAGISTTEATPLVDRLATLASPDEAIELYERHVARAATEEDRLAALDVAVRVAVKRGSVERIQRFFVTVLAEAPFDRALDLLEKAAADGDRRRGSAVIRGALASALAEVDPHVIDGGRTRSALLRRASRIARRDLDDADQAFEWLGDALFARLDGVLEEALAPIGDHAEDLARAAAAMRDLRALLDAQKRSPEPRPTQRPATVPPPPPAQRPSAVPPPPSTGRQPAPSRPPPPPPVPRVGPRGPLELADPFPAPPRSGSTPPPAPASNRLPPRRRLTGEELLADLFESMLGLDYCKDAIEAAAYTVTLAMETLGCPAGLAHLYDIDRREYVVVHARGPEAAAVRGMRTSDTDPLAAEAMRTSGAVVVRDPADARLSGRRWEVYRAAAPPLAAVICARAALAGRYLGMIELCHLAGDEGFAEGDDNALAYIAGRFTDFVAERGVVLPEEG